MTPSQKLIMHRIQSGCSPEKIAVALRISVRCYYDYEWYPGDLDDCASCGELRALLQVLNIEIQDLYRPDSRFPSRPFALRDLVGRIQDHLDVTGKTLFQFEDEFGWEIGNLLCEPIDEWKVPVVFLRDLSRPRPRLDRCLPKSPCRASPHANPA